MTCNVVCKIYATAQVEEAIGDPDDDENAVFVSDDNAPSYCWADYFSETLRT